MFECNGELVDVSVVVAAHRRLFGEDYLMRDVWCVWRGCLAREWFFDVLDNDGEAL